MTLQVIPIKIEKEIKAGDDLVGLVLESGSMPVLEDGDVLVFSQKVVSKQEGQVVKLSEVRPSALAVGIASEYDKDPRIIELILGQSRRIVRMSNGILISETTHGFVCANAGVDESNVEEGYASLLPRDAGASAQNLRRKIKEKTGKDAAVIISDTFGRPFRQGQTNVSLGVAGIPEILDYAGTRDSYGRVLRVTAIAIADEICSATELVMGKSMGVPVSLVRNFRRDYVENTINDVVRPRSEDLFR